MLDSSKLKEFAHDNFNSDVSGRMFFRQVENTVGKGEIARYEQFSFSHSAFKRLELKTRKKPGLVWERVKTPFAREWLIKNIENLLLCKNKY